MDFQGDAFYSAVELAEVKAYHSPGYTWQLLDPVLYFCLMALFLRFGVRPLYRRCEALSARLGVLLAPVLQRRPLRAVSRAMERLWGAPDWGPSLLFPLAVHALLQIVFWPAIFYFGYLHEQRHGMWQASVGRFLWESAKSTAVAGLAIAALAFGAYALVRRFPRRWWLVLGVACGSLLGVSQALDPYRARLHHEQERLADGALRARLETLLAKARVDYADILVEKTSDVSPRVQAYFAGQGPTRTIVLSDSLLASMDAEEVEAVVAHEAHHTHEISVLRKVLSPLALLVFLFLLDRLFQASARRGWFGTRSPADVRTLPLVFFLFSLAATAIAPAQGYFARNRERAADRHAVILTGNPQAFRRMLIKATRLNKSDPTPPALIVWLGASHPSMSERLAAIGEGAIAAPESP